jgi:hypothetical protein
MAVEWQRLRAGRKVMAVAGRWLVVAISTVLAVVFGGQGAADAATSAGDAAFMARIAAVESGGRGGVVNQFGYAGMYQVGVAAATDAGWVQRGSGCGGNDWSCVAWTDKAKANGVSSLDTFLGNSNAQTALEGDLLNRQRGYMTAYGLDQYVGQEINGRVMTEYDILAGIHNQGTGAMSAYLKSGGSLNPRDGNGTGVSTYLDRFNGATGTTAAGSGKGVTGPAQVAVTGRQIAGCSASTRQRLSTAVASAAQASVQKVTAVYRPPVHVMESCVAGLLARLRILKLLSGLSVSALVDTLLAELEQQACAALSQMVNQALQPVFDANAFIRQAVPSGSEVMIGGRDFGGGGGAVDVTRVLRR